MVTSLPDADRKSTRLNSSHQIISYAVFCLKKKKSDARRGARFNWYTSLLRVPFILMSGKIARQTSLRDGYGHAGRFYFFPFFFFNVTATTEIYTLSLHDALPIFFQVIYPRILKQPSFLPEKSFELFYFLLYFFAVIEYFIFKINLNNITAQVFEVSFYSYANLIY